MISAPSTPTPMKATTRPMPQEHGDCKLPAPGADEPEQRADRRRPADLRGVLRQCHARQRWCLPLGRCSAQLNRRPVPSRRSRARQAADPSAGDTGRRARSARRGVPLCATAPSCSTRMRSALITLDRRCARISVVRPRHQPIQRLLDHRLVLGIDRRQRFVQHQDRRVAQQRAGDGDALTLAARQARCRARRSPSGSRPAALR